LSFSEVQTSEEEEEGRGAELQEERGEGGGDTHLPDIKITTVDSLNGSPVSKVIKYCLYHEGYRCKC
jgi:hypothetical protein